MFRRILQYLRSAKPSPSTPPGKASIAELTRICDAYWDSLTHPYASPAERPDYSEYVAAANELGTRGPEMAPWALSHLDHPESDAREQAAFLLGELAGRNQLSPDQLTSAIEKLSRQAVRPWQEDTKELQANSAAISALGKTRDKRAIPVLQEIIFSPEWEEDDNAWEAARVLGHLVNQPFEQAEDPLQAARAWLRSQGK